MTFYIGSIIYATLSLFFYVNFRIGVNSCLRYTKNSKTFIRKNTKGMRNYWLYEKIHKEIDLGYIYYLNWMLLILCPLYFLLAVSFGWADAMQIPIAILNILVCFALFPSLIFADIYTNYEDYGQAFVLLKPGRFRGYHSSLYTLLGLLGMVAASAYLFYLALK